MSLPWPVLTPDEWRERLRALHPERRDLDSDSWREWEERKGGRERGQRVKPQTSDAEKREIAKTRTEKAATLPPWRYKAGASANTPNHSRALREAVHPDYLTSLDFIAERDARSELIQVGNIDAIAPLLRLDESLVTNATVLP